LAFARKARSTALGTCRIVYCMPALYRLMQASSFLFHSHSTGPPRTQCVQSHQNAQDKAHSCGKVITLEESRDKPPIRTNFADWRGPGKTHLNTAPAFSIDDDLWKHRQIPGDAPR
jgi:hypothetical protein